MTIIGVIIKYKEVIKGVSMKLGIVGHPRMISIITQLIKKHYKSYDVESIPFISTEAETVANYIKENEYIYDGLLFTGKIPYDLINSKIISQKPWAYINLDASQLLKVLLKAILKYGYDIKRISIDSFSKEEIDDVYKELELGDWGRDIYISDKKSFSPSFLLELEKFHRDNFVDNKVSFCITSISRVYESLDKENVPCVILDPTLSNVKESLDILKLKMKIQQTQNDNIVVIAVERDLPNEYALVKENEYQLALDSMKISESIYLFAQRIQAAVVEQEMGKYLLFTTKNLFEIETDKLQKFSLLDSHNTQRFGTLSIGIGYGETTREAKYKASLGLLKAKKSGGNQAYKVQYDSYIGPINPSVESSDNNIDGIFQTIAFESGISINSILKIQLIIDQEKRDSFTSVELAKLYGVSLRSMNRMIEKLINVGYVEIIGRRILSTAGRPRRVLKFKFN